MEVEGFPDMKDLLVEFKLMSPIVELMLRLPFRAVIKHVMSSSYSDLL